MADKKLHKSYTKKITSLKTIDSIGFLDKVITEWEYSYSRHCFYLAQLSLRPGNINVDN